ncbi:monooxygenase [Dictyobacter sp. S3.2.2.5]|uniref:Monooxygenase n=1 Tax=Dictyobacter halimunensis TaxID=3026934 RepID=A0ABQ6G2D9_9CHLR|nr:monooxygenase [Dictyobacter sp. S3.2.2.5]
MSSSSLHIIVIGGGIGGLCLAQGLKGAGVSVAVYERNPSSIDWLQGYRIHINAVGSRALHECLPPVLWDAFRATAGQSSAGFGFITEQLKDLLVISEARMTGQNTDPVEGQYPVSRIALRHLLLAGLEDVVHFDKTFERYELQPEGKVTAVFSDGSTATGDVLVGADGANSRVCKQYLPQARRVETNALAVGGKLMLTPEARAWLPRPIQTRMNIVIPPQKYFLFNAVFDHTYASREDLSELSSNLRAAGLDPELLFADTSNYVLWGFAANVNAYPASAEALSGPPLQKLVLQMINDWHPDLRRLVADADPATVAPIRLKASVPIGPWESSRVTVLGDALHNMTPIGGLGANMALRDASSLARALSAVQRGEAQLLPAIHDYEAGMIKHGFDAVRETLANTRRATADSRLERGMVRAWFRACNALPFLKQKMFAPHEPAPSSP